MARESDDVPANRTTTAFLANRDVYRGFLWLKVFEEYDFNTTYEMDKDWIRVRLKRGRTYRFDALAIGNALDPYLFIFDGQGKPYRIDRSFVVQAGASLKWRPYPSTIRPDSWHRSAWYPCTARLHPNSSVSGWSPGRMPTDDWLHL